MGQLNQLKWYKCAEFCLFFRLLNDRGSIVDGDGSAADQRCCLRSFHLICSRFCSIFYSRIVAFAIVSSIF
ncbi:B3 domain-containing protein [Trichinella spiralis]|uniref:B3 domain-containing protein n=1 Tax=Trichinella spiralis TaxID=6334 RepID=A0ABR3KAR7_TRISP